MAAGVWACGRAVVLEPMVLFFSLRKVLRLLLIILMRFCWSPFEIFWRRATPGVVRCIGDAGFGERRWARYRCR